MSATTGSKMNGSSSSSGSGSEFRKMTQREHVMEKPEMYIGNTDTQEEWAWVYDAEKQKMVHRKVQLNAGLLKIVDEILVNARDEYIRSLGKEGRLPVKRIDVEAELKEGVYKLAVSNDGQGIPVEIHPVEKVYIPELIFGNMLTSSNYDKNEQKLVGGTFGVGSKATNIFSKEFTVESKDPVKGLEYKQTWKNNMLTVGKASIKKYSGKKGSVRIEFVPDLARFPGSLDEGGQLHKDMRELIHTRVIELAAVIGKDVKVTWNSEDVPVRSFEKFVRLFVKDDASLAYEQCGDRWEVAAVLTTSLFEEDDSAGKPEFRHIAFTNGINNRRGGKHVEYVSKHILDDLVEIAAKKKITLKPGQLKDHVTFFVNAMIVNPAFDSQTKVTLTTPASKFGSVPVFSGKLVKGLVGAGILEEAQLIADAKAAKDAKKTDGVKKRVIHDIPKLFDALHAGTSKSNDCTLILTEGDSAAGSAVAGLKILGREKWGVFPLKGKILNIRNSGVEQMNANEEITNIKKILGLEKGMKYKDTKSLRYGRVLIMSDQDVDGFHIRGLLMNLFHTEWPELMKMGFLCALMTPLVKMTKGKEVLCFYSEAELEAWRESVGESVASKYHGKYYKGLGSSDRKEAVQWFETLNDIQYEWDEHTNESMELAFHNKKADERKTWLSKYDPKRCIKPRVEGGKRFINYTRFVHDELIHFSNASNIRALPHIMDGLKPSLRKILFACFKRNLRSELRVAQLAGYVSEHAAYHHGEASLNQSIIAMAQVFVGANNLNLLVPAGQFGSRLMGGDDAAAPRYINTHLEKIVETIYKKEDEPILQGQTEEGQSIEPLFYAPVVPMIAINGSDGIGTGFSAEIPPHKPEEVVELLQSRLRGESETLAGRSLKPWWIGFKGTVELKEGTTHTWATRGLYTWNDDKCSVHITELPVGVWIDVYKTHLSKLQNVSEKSASTEKKGQGAKGRAKKGDDASSKSSEKKRKEKPILREYEDLSNDVDVNVTLYLEPDYYREAKANVADFEKKFKLVKVVSTNNMHAFDTDLSIVRYDTIGDILEAFFGKRLAMYEQRRQHLIKQLQDEIEELDAKYRFVEAVVSKTLRILNEEDSVILDGLVSLGLPPRSDRENPKTLGAYEYLLRMRVDRMKKSSVEDAKKQLAKAQEELAVLKATTASKMWLGELDQFLEAWSKHKAYMMDMLSASQEVPTKKSSAPKLKSTKSVAKTVTKAVKSKK